MNRTELRRLVDRKLKGKMPQAIWDYLVRHHYVSEAEKMSGNAVEWLLASAKELMNLPETRKLPLPGIPSRRQRRERALPLRLQVISCLLAAQARKDENVIRYRSTFLASGLLKHAQVGDWIRRKQKTSKSLPAARHTSLDFSVPDGKSVQKITVHRDGALRILADLASSLASLYSWQRWEATIFVLTDMVPSLSANEVAIKRGPLVSFENRGLEFLHCLSRFIITVTPGTSPREVGELYGRIRSKVFRRSRGLGEKHMKLAGFASAYDQVSHDVMKGWNRKHPKWRYSRYSLFARDVRVATERLLCGSSMNRTSLGLGTSQ